VPADDDVPVYDAAAPLMRDERGVWLPLDADD